MTKLTILTLMLIISLTSSPIHAGCSGLIGFRTCTWDIYPWAKSEMLLSDSNTGMVYLEMPKDDKSFKNYNALIDQFKSDLQSLSSDCNRDYGQITEKFNPNILNSETASIMRELKFNHSGEIDELLVMQSLLRGVSKSDTQVHGNGAKDCRDFFAPAITKSTQHAQLNFITTAKPKIDEACNLLEEATACLIKLADKGISHDDSSRFQTSSPITTDEPGPGYRNLKRGLKR